MAVDLNGKKTSLDDNASIYDKRDDNMSEKEKWQKMSITEKKDHFFGYYFIYIVAGIAILSVIGFFVYKDVIAKKDVYFDVALINEMAMDGPIEEMADKFTTSIGLDPGKKLASFHMYFTNSKVAEKVGASVASDLTTVSSKAFAGMLDGMILGHEDLEGYQERKLYMDLTKVFSENELKYFEDNGLLYYPEKNNESKHPYGINLIKSREYDQIFSMGGGIVKDPYFVVMFNSKNVGVAEKLMHFMYPDMPAE
ncbi:hypothetical protein [Eubacterium xylanophilum]|uniref:hypothetical protein n=1 Tax=Eubacterium xylanophilum TaxID=39497 RepID=UPI00047C3D66|nr:hypothetical protein [Eubacterium xylanophilum]